MTTAQLEEKVKQLEEQLRDANIKLSNARIVIKAAAESTATITFLIQQLDTIEHLQDHERIAEIARKYNIKRIYER